MAPTIHPVTGVWGDAPPPRRIYFFDSDSDSDRGGFSRLPTPCINNIIYIYCSPGERASFLSDVGHTPYMLSPFTMYAGAGSACASSSYTATTKRSVYSLGTTLGMHPREPRDGPRGQGRVSYANNHSQIATFWSTLDRHAVALKHPDILAVCNGGQGGAS